MVSISLFSQTADGVLQVRSLLFIQSLTAGTLVGSPDQGNSGG